MIEFKKITVKNFLSYGDMPTTVQLDTHQLTLIKGKNGTGKSVIFLDAIFFVLFNKTYRKIKKSLITNSFNNGQCLVELEFSTRGSNYVIRRGIKPNIFELVKDNEVLDSNVLSKDLQAHLEEDILRINEKTFGQTSVIGSANFVPFMKLDSARRREVIDDVLNVGVFTSMAKLAKEDLSITEKQLSDIDTEIRITKASAESIQRVISVLTSNQTDLLNDFKEQLSTYEIKYNERIQEEVSLSNKIKELEKALPPEIDLFPLKNEVSELNRKLSSADKKIDSVMDIHVCPTCIQKVSDEHKESIKRKAELAKSDIKESLSKAELSLAELEEKYKARSTQVLEIDKLKDSVRLIKYDINSLEGEINNIKARIDKIKEADEQRIEDERKSLRSLVVKAKELLVKKEELREIKEIQSLSVSLLKDNGIKASVVKEYLPVLNSRINTYLKGYGFDINFTLNETFDETVSSRGRHDFTYESFSEGEKERIDWSIVMSLREIGIAMNSSHVNILVLDEILDGSLEEESRSATLDMLVKHQDRSNIFVISHTESNSGFYDQIIHVKKRGDFSELEYSI